MDKYLYPYEVKDRLTKISILAGAEGTVLYEVPPEGYELDNMGMSEEQLTLLNKLITNKNNTNEFISCNDDVLKCCAFLFKYNIKITEKMINVLVNKLMIKKTKSECKNSISNDNVDEKKPTTDDGGDDNIDEKKADSIPWEEVKFFINLTDDTFLHIGNLSKLHHENQIVGHLVDKAAKALLNTYFDKSPREMYHNMINNNKIEYMIAFQTLVNLCGETKQNVPTISGDIWNEVLKYSKMYWDIVKKERRALYIDDNGYYATLNSNPSWNPIPIGYATSNRYNNAPYITYNPNDLNGLNGLNNCVSGQYNYTITDRSSARVNNDIITSNQSNGLYYTNDDNTITYKITI